MTKGRGPGRKVIPIANPIRPVNRLSPIEIVHARNKSLLKKYGLKVGSVLEHKVHRHKIQITSIHPLYGWVVCSYCDAENIGWENLKQDMGNIDNFIINDIKIC